MDDNTPAPPRSRRAIGRPSFKSSYVQRAFDFCLLGLTDERIAELFNVLPRTLTTWKKTYPSFRRAFERGRDEADAKIAKALYQRAMGYSHPAEKIHVTKDGDVVKVPYTQHYPPDSAALAFYLSNRSRAMWRTKPDSAINISLSWEQLVLDSLKLEASDKAKMLEHEPPALPKPDDTTGQRPLRG
jgi:hypothetical protein